MRGKPTDKFLIDIPVRIIPAHAGQTATPILSLNALADHPRACGANGGVLAGFLRGAGSSPRMRGKRVRTS